MAQQLALLQSRAGSRMVTNPPQFRTSGNPAMISKQLSQRLDRISVVTHVFRLQEWQKMAVSNMVAGRNIILTAWVIIECICCTLRSWVHEIFIHSRTVSLRWGDNYASKCSFDNFPHTNYISLWVENCQNHTLLFCCSLIPGRRFKKLENLWDRFAR